MAVARAIAKQPEVLLCDEPTGALDSGTGVLVLAAIERANRELGAITVLVTHNTVIAEMALQIELSLLPTEGLLGSEAMPPAGSRTSSPGSTDHLSPEVAPRVVAGRGQFIVIALVIACGLATCVATFNALRLLDGTRREYYEHYHFGDVFASVQRAPEALADMIRRIPGVAKVQTRIAVNVALEIEGENEPVLARALLLPAEGEPVVNGIALRRGRSISSECPEEVVVSESFAMAHGLAPGDHVWAVVPGGKLRLTITGTALSPEYIYALGPGQIVPDDQRFGIVWLGRPALAAAVGFGDTFNDVSIVVETTASVRDVIGRVDVLLRPYGRRRLRPYAPAVGRLPIRDVRPANLYRPVDSGDLRCRRRIPFPHCHRASDRHAATVDRFDQIAWI